MRTFCFFANRHWREVHRLADAATGLVGAVQRLMVNGKTYQNLAVNVTQHNTEIYDGLPCPSNENPCHNGGVCLPLLNSYLCKCASSYNGLHCEFCKHLSENHFPRLFDWTNSSLDIGKLTDHNSFPFFFENIQLWATMFPVAKYPRGQFDSMVTIIYSLNTDLAEGAFSSNNKFPLV